MIENPSDRRRHERVPYSGRIEIRVYDKSDGTDVCAKEFAGRTNDLSESGVCISTDAELAVGMMLDLRIAVPNPPTFFIRPATVRWCRPSEDDGAWTAGIEFRSKSSMADETWRQFIRELARCYAPVATAA